MDSMIARLASLTNDGNSHAGPTAPPAVVSGDLERGRAALRRHHRRRWLATGVTLCAAVAIATTVAVAGTGSGTTDHRTVAGAPAIKLVAYTGQQQPGFTVATVPQGYVLQGAQPASLDIAPAGDTSSLDAFEGKLVVMLQSVDAQPDHSGTPVTVNGHQGWIRRGDEATILEYNDGTHEVLVQAWNNIRLTNDQLVNFADGVTVTAAVQVTHG